LPLGYKLSLDDDEDEDENELDDELLAVVVGTVVMRATNRTLSFVTMRISKDTIGVAKRFGESLGDHT
jgi:hypothetical protein